MVFLVEQWVVLANLVPSFHHKKDVRLQLVEDLMETVRIFRGEKRPDVCPAELELFSSRSLSEWPLICSPDMV